MTITEYRHNLGTYVGQPKMKELIVTHLEATRATGAVFPHLLLIGPPGSGKTTLATIVADTLGRPFVGMSTPPVSRMTLAHTVSQLGDDGGVVFVDEIHEWGKAQDWLLTLLEPPGYIDLPWGRMDFPGLSVIAATTEREKVRKPLMQRFPLRPSFEPYTDAEMAFLAGFMAEMAGLKLAWEDSEALGRAAGGIPRQVRTLITHALALRDSGTEVAIETVLEMAEVEPDGLTHEHINYLRHLNDMNSEAGLSTLSARMRLHESEVRDLERLLLDRDLIALTKSGRALKPGGARRLRAAA